MNRKENAVLLLHSKMHLLITKILRPTLPICWDISTLVGKQSVLRTRLMDALRRQMFPKDLRCRYGLHRKKSLKLGRSLLPLLIRQINSTVASKKRTKRLLIRRATRMSSKISPIPSLLTVWLRITGRGKIGVNSSTTPPTRPIRHQSTL